ncbi:hypothetical protein KFE98_08175 [bacterium SCSIO 12741]|nr:hypothetical protein KFE98_08175 [bacterium SCSIO 12741]
MTTKKYILATIAAFFLSNILTTMWYMGADEANMVSFRRPEVNYLGLMANHLIYAGLFVYFFPFFFQSRPVVSRSLVYGILMSAMMFIPSALVVRSIWTVDFNGIFVLNTIAHLVIGAIMGSAVALIYNSGKSAK